MQRECEFKPLSYTSMGNFGEEVCDLAERMGARVRTCFGVCSAVVLLLMMV